MTTATTSTAHGSATGSGLTFLGVLNSEWIKLRTLRSTVWCFAIIFLLTVGLALLLAGVINSATGRSVSTEQQQQAFVQVATLGIGFSQLVGAVLGALMITGEYGTGMIRSTLTAVPKRIPALVAKAIVLGVVTFVVSLVSIVVGGLVAIPLLSSKGFSVDFGDGKLWLALLGGAGYLALIAVFALAVGALVRNSAAGIAASLGVILVLPTVFSIISALANVKWLQNVDALLPSEAGAKMYDYVVGTVTTTAGVVSLEPWQGLVVLAAWVVVLFVAASVLLKRRDA